MEFRFTYTTPQKISAADNCGCQILFAPIPQVSDRVGFCINTALPQAGVNAHSLEAIEANGMLPISVGAQGQTQYVCTESWALVQVNIPEEYAAAALAEHTFRAYIALFNCFKTLGFTSVVRMWNYFAYINLGDGDDEAYKQFCSGRQRAFTALDITPQQFPAASALGRKSGGLQVYALATHARCVHIENPVQTSAYSYPREYGPASPSFARATLAGNTLHTLFISGTASILNAQSHHLGDAAKQAQLSCENILRVISQAEAMQHCRFKLSLVKVYVRYAQLRAQVESIVLQQLGSASELLWLEADICRAELLIEIEGIALRAE